MDEQRIEAYLNLINTLLLNRESKEKINKIMNDNQELIDSGLWQTMFQEAQKLESAGNQDDAEFLLKIANAMAYQDYTNFLMEVLRTTGKSKGDSKVVYPLLQQNLDKLDNNFADILRNWATVKFSEFEADVAESIAKCIGNFSNLIQEFSLGNKANNMEISIAGYEVMLKVFTSKSHRETWAAIQNSLGAAYRDRIRGDKAENMEFAIAAFQNALQVYTKKDFLIEWAMTQYNLGTAYSDRITEDKAENLESAISAFQNALQVYTKKDFPMEWAMTQSNLGNAYKERIKENKAENMESAISAFQQPLLVYNQTDFPINWAITQYNLGLAYRDRIRGDKAENMESAISAFQQALLVLTQTDFPTNWAMTQNNLGNAYIERIKEDKAQNIESAIATFQQALLVLTQTDFPTNWAMTQNNLGNAYIERIREDKAENIESAIAAFQQALLVRTQTNFPIEWAETQNNLGNAYKERIRGKKAENMESAISAYEQALQVRTQTDFPIEWAMTQNNLGTAYRERIRGDKAENMESAIAAYEQALQVRTQTDFPINWAITQNNLGNAYRERIRGDKAENMESAIAAFQQALQVRTQTDFRIDWAMTQNNLGNAYSDRIRGDKAKNIEFAIAAYQQALQVRTLEANPIAHLKTTHNLGNLYFENQNWQHATDNYEQAITAVEVSRSWATTEERRQEIIKENIDVYGKAILAYIYIDRRDKALEIAERSQARNLVELLTKRNLVIQSDAPPEVTQRFWERQREIRRRNSELEKVRQQRSGQDLQQRRSLEESEKRLNEELQELQQQLETVLNQIQEDDSTFRLTQEVQPITFVEIQQLATEEQTAFIEWYITAEKFVTFVILPPTATTDSELFIRQSTEADLKNLREWAKEYTGKYDELQEAYFQRAENLDKYANLQQEWETEITTRLEKLGEILHIKEVIQPILESKCERLTLVPHLFLHLLPLHALVINPENSQENPEKIYLQDYFDRGIRYAPSCQILQKVRQRQCQDFQSLFAIQTPTLDLEGKDLSVVSAIQKQFYDREVLKTNKATKLAVIDHPKLSLANSVLFFCHGKFNFDSPLDSGLELADGTLTLADIIQYLNLKNCRLVTLAACETGLTDFRNPEYVGLPSGFLLAGSTNIVASLWSVRSDATALLMLRLYQELEKSDNIVVGLKTAQNWLRNANVQELIEWVRESPLLLLHKTPLEGSFAQMKTKKGANFKPYKSPYFWAGFCVVGKGE